MAALGQRQGGLPQVKAAEHLLKQLCLQAGGAVLLLRLKLHAAHVQHQAVFALLSLLVGLKQRKHLLRRAADGLFVQLGQVAAGGDPAARQRLANRAHELDDAVWALVHHADGRTAALHGQQLFAQLLLLPGQKAIERELARVKSADGQCTGHGRRAGHGQHLDAQCRCLAHEHTARVADAGRARVGYDGDGQVLVEHPLGHRGRALLLVVLVVGDAGRIDAEMVEQRAGDARVLRRDQIGAFERLDCTRGHVA